MSASYDFLVEVQAFDDLVLGRFVQLVWDDEGNEFYRRYHHLERPDALVPDKFYDATCDTTGTALKVRFQSVPHILDVEDAAGKWKLALGVRFYQDPPYAYLAFPNTNASDEAALHHYGNLLKLSLPLDANGNYVQPTFTVINNDPPLQFAIDDTTLFSK